VGSFSRKSREQRPREPRRRVSQWRAVPVLATDDPIATPSGATSRTSGLRPQVCPGRRGSPGR
jgi:hypothetical protein